MSNERHKKLMLRIADHSETLAARVSMRTIGETI
jgi:hypothetical protein